MNDILTRLRQTFGLAGIFQEAEKRYNPDQPRYPEGDERGGQWSPEGGAAVADEASASTVGFDMPFPAEMDETERKKTAVALTKSLDRPGWEYDTKEFYGPGILYRRKKEGEETSQYRVSYDKYGNTWKVRANFNFSTSLGGNSVANDLPNQPTLQAALDAVEQHEQEWWRSR